MLHSDDFLPELRRMRTSRTPTRQNTHLIYTLTSPNSAHTQTHTHTHIHTHYTHMAHTHTHTHTHFDRSWLGVHTRGTCLRHTGRDTYIVHTHTCLQRAGHYTHMIWSLYMSVLSPLFYNMRAPVTAYYICHILYMIYIDTIYIYICIYIHCINCDTCGTLRYSTWVAIWIRIYILNE